MKLIFVSVSDGPELQSKLRVLCEKQGLDFQPVSETQLLDSVGSLSPESHLLVLGPGASSPARFVQSVHSVCRELGLLVLTTVADHKSVKQSIMMSPFVGSGVRCHAQDADLETLIGELVSRIRQRQLHLRVQKDLVKRAEKSLGGEHQRAVVLHHLMEHAPIGVLILTQQGTVRAINEHACETLGHQSAKIVGQSFVSLFDPDTEPELESLLCAASEKRGTRESKTIRYKKHSETNDESILEITCSQEDEQITIAILRDVTAEHRAKEQMESFQAILEDQVRARTHELESKNKELEQFAYIASHDLQEPLRTVNSVVEILESELHGKDEKDEQVEHCLKFLSEATTRMHKLIQGLLEYSRIGMERIREEVDCNQILQAIQEDFASLLETSKAEITVEELPIVSGSIAELRSLFQNLISNAVKFQPSGNVPRVRVSACQNKDGMWHFKVEDNGIGIDQKYANKIFVIYQRLNSRKEFSGYGIGLAHARKIVELHGGRIWVESSPGAGSCFHFTLGRNSEEMRWSA